jgi:hypothetical protein
MTLTTPKYISDAAERFGIDTTRKIDNPLSTGCIGKDSTTPATPQHTQQQKRLQQIIGVLLYYARSVDSTVLTRIRKLSTQQKDPTGVTLMAAERTLQYLATQPEASVVFHRSDMKLICYSDASYLNETKARSRCGGYIYLGDANISSLNGLFSPGAQSSALSLLRRRKVSWRPHS